MPAASYTLRQIADRLVESGLAVELVGQPETVITGPAPLRFAQPGQISFLASSKPKILRDLETSNASAIVVGDQERRLAARPKVGALPAPIFDRAAKRSCLLVVADPVEAFDRILGMFPTPIRPPAAGIDPAARVDPAAELADSVAVGPGAVIQAGSRIGPRTVIWPNVFIGVDCRIGADCVLHPGVVLREQTELGERVIIHANSTIGADGFGYRTDQAGVHHKVPQVGRVVVGDDVEIGANTTIDRAKFGATRIGDGAKIDNLCQIAHNVQIGPGCLIAALVGIAGSAELDHHVVLAGHVGLRDNIHLGAGAVVTACSCVSQDVEPGAVLSGIPARDHRAKMRELALTARLAELFGEVKELKERIERMETKPD